MLSVLPSPWNFYSERRREERGEEERRRGDEEVRRNGSGVNTQRFKKGVVVVVDHQIYLLPMFQFAKGLTHCRGALHPGGGREKWMRFDALHFNCFKRTLFAFCLFCFWKFSAK